MATADKVTVIPCGTGEPTEARMMFGHDAVQIHQLRTAPEVSYP